MGLCKQALHEDSCVDSPCSSCIVRVGVGRSLSQREAKAAAVLLTCVVTSADSKQLSPALIAAIMEIAVTKLNHIANPNDPEVPGNKGMRVRILETILAVIIYDVDYCLQLFNGNAELSKLVFNSLFGALPHMDQPATERLIVMAFSQLLTRLPASNLPAVVASNLQPILQQVVREVALIQEKEAEDDEEEDEDDMDGSNDSSDIDEAAIRSAALDVPEGGYGEDEDCINAEDESYREYIENMNSTDSSKRVLYSGGDLVCFPSENWRGSNVR